MSKPINAPKKRRVNKFKKYKELVRKQPNLRRDTIARKLRVTEIQVTAFKQRAEAEKRAKDKIAAIAERPQLIIDRKTKKPKHAKRTKAGRINWR